MGNTGDDGEEAGEVDAGDDGEEAGEVAVTRVGFWPWPSRWVAVTEAALQPTHSQL